MSNNSTVPGLQFPTQRGMLAGNPRDSAMQSMNNNAQLQAQANTALSGGRLRKTRYGGGQIVVPQYQMLYEPQGGPGTTPNNIIAGSAQTSTQATANAALDAGATTMGGSKRSGSKRRRSRKGGNPDWLWGCMSGGRKSRTRKTMRKSRKSRKSRKYRKH